MKRNTTKSTCTLLFITLTLTLTSSLMGCQASPKAEPNDAVGTSAHAQELNDAQKHAFTLTLKSYEALRGALAQDKLSDVSGLATQLELTLQQVSEGAPKDMSAQISAMSEATLKLKAEGLKADEQRRLFGEVSRGVVALLSTHKSLAEGLYVFSCPMAQGYKKWVQPSSKLENPYMGGRMLRCGGRSELSP